MATKDNFFQTSDGLWLYYEVTGEGRPIVLIPGFGEALTMWQYAVPVLSQRFQVVCLDPRGHGRSMKAAGNNRQKRMAQDIRELIDHLGLEDVLLVGHSLGGAIVATKLFLRLFLTSVVSVTASTLLAAVGLYKIF